MTEEQHLHKGQDLECQWYKWDTCRYILRSIETHFPKAPSKHHAQTQGTLANKTIETNKDNVLRKPLGMWR